MSQAQTTFNTGYLVSISAALIASYLVNLDIAGGSPMTNIIVKFFLVPITVAYVTLLIINMLFPYINQGGRVASSYVTDTVLDRINNTNYMQIFPPIFLVFIMFMVLLFR